MHRQYNAGTFTAFCRRGGDWKLPKEKVKVNWNLEIQSIFAAKLMTSFDLLQGDIDIIENETITNIHNLYKSLEEELEGKLPRWTFASLSY